MDEGGTLAPVIAIVQVGCDGMDSPALVGGTVIAGAIVVPGPDTGLVRTTATTTTTITTRPAITRYGVRGFFFFRTARQFGQTVRLASMVAPQWGQVFCAM
jgi:hypothetical protein